MLCLFIRSFQVVARQATLDEKRYRENPSLSAEAATAAAAAAAAASSSKSTAPGSGLIQAAKAALAGAVAYESLTEDQKQQRLAEQRAASAEAAIAIAEAAKEEEQKRLELAALERQRQQELEEEAAAGAADEAEGQAPPRVTVMSAGDMPTSEKAKAAASSESVETGASEGRDSSSRPPPVRSFLAARKAGAGGSPRASDPSSGSGMVPGSGSSGSRSLVRQNGGGSALEAAAAATAAVEAVTGMKSFTPRGAKEAVAREEAAAVAAAAAGTASEGHGMGRTELPESRAKAVEAQAKATQAKAKALEAQAKAADAHRKAAEAQIKAAEATGSQLSTTTGWGENGDQLGPGSIKDRLGAFTSGNSKDPSASEPPVNGRPHDRIFATAFGSRSARFQAEGVEGESASADGTPASVSSRTSRLEDVSSDDAQYERSVTGEVVVASKIDVTGGFSRSTTSSLSPVPESAEEVSASGVSFGVPGSSADGRATGRWVGVDNDRDSPGSVGDGHEAFSGSTPAFVHGNKAGIGSTDGSEIGGAQTCGWGENGEQSAPGSIRGRLGAFSGKKDAAPSASSADGSNSHYRRNVPGGEIGDEEADSASAVSIPGMKSGDQTTSRSVNGRLRALPGSNDGATPPDGDISSMNGGPLSRREQNGAEAFFASNPDGWGVNGDQSAPGSIKDRLGAYSGNNSVGTTSGRRRSGNQTATRSEDTKAVSADASTFCAVGMKLGNGDMSGSDRSEGTSELSPVGVGATSTARRGMNGEVRASDWGENGDQSAPGSVKSHSAALPRKSGASYAALPSEDDASAPRTAGASGEEMEGEEERKVNFEGRERRPQTSGWGEGGDQAAPGSITDRLGKFSGIGKSSSGSDVTRSIGTSRGRTVTNRGGSGVGGGVINNEGYTGAPVKSPPSRERGASQASASASEETDELVSVDDQQDDNGDGSVDLPSVRARVAALSGKGSRAPRISGRSRVGGGSGKISSPGSRSPPYQRDAEAGASASGYTESEGSGAGEEEQVSGDGERPARSTGSGWGESGDKSGPGSVKGRLSALTGNKAIHQGSRSPRPGGSATSMESVVGKRVGLGSRSGSHESPTDDGNQDRANMSPWSASVDRSTSGSFKERLAAFSKNSSSSSGSSGGVSRGDMRTRFGPASGTRSPPFRRGGSFKGGSGGDGSGESSPISGGDHFKAAFSGRSPTYRRNGSRADSSEDSKSLSSPDKPRSRKEEAIAALAAAEEAAAREEEVWTRKMNSEEDRRRAIEKRVKAASEGRGDDFEDEEGGGRRGASARRHKQESKHAFDDQDYAEDDDRQGFGGDSDSGMGVTRPRRRAMKKSGFPYGGGGGTSTSRDIEGISEEDQEFEEEEEERDEMRPWPEAGGDDEDIETMEAKKVGARVQEKLG